jgi:serine-type D-Ala-D-Ala carboxypeptidase (penicillin-binding protein 5/6)
MSYLKNAFAFAILVFVWSASLGAPVPVPTPPAIAARGYILVDHDSGAVLAEKNSDERMEPASLTKLLTVFVVFTELHQGKFSLDDPVHISEKAWRTGGSRMFVEVGKHVKLEDLLKGIIIQSGNDASVALAEYVAGDEAAFAQLMNEHAKRLGMTSSHFVNATGLPNEDEYTTARDMATLASALIRNFPEYYEWHSTREFKYNNITQYNRNKLLWRDKSVDGLKTGHTSSAGYCLVASAKRDDMRLVSVVLGTASSKERARQSQTLLNYGFRFFETHRLFAADEVLKHVRVWKGNRERIGFGLSKDLYVTVPRGQYDNLNALMEVDRKIVAPVTRGKEYGKVTVTLGDKKIADRALIALQEVGEGSLWQRLSDSVKLYFD